MWRSKRGTPEYQCWLVDHQYESNHKGSSGSMESVGAVTMFKRSLQKNKFIYKEYLGDGDTSFNDVIVADPYKEYGIMPVKLECSLNGLIWARVPKRVFVSKSTLELGTYSAILASMMVQRVLLVFLDIFGLHGKVSNISATSKNKKRISQMRCKLSEKGKKRRKTLRVIKKGHLDEEKAKECNDSYVSGGF